MGYIPAMFSNESVTFYIDGEPYSADQSLPGYRELLDELKQPDPDTEKLIRLTQPIQAIRTAVEDAVVGAEAKGPDYLPKGTVSVTRNAVLFNGRPIDGVLVDRILWLLSEGFDIMPMVRFLENLYQNPADFARDELYLWLENSDLPITEDGCFLAYKNVNGDYTSIHDGRTKNNPGTVVQMPRQQVDPVRDRTCSRGLHFCSKSYLPHFSRGSNGRTVLLKINPADVVSIPSDYNNAKGRAWKYEVLHDVADPQATSWKAVVSVNGGSYTPPAALPTNPDDEILVIPSDLSKALFAAVGEIGLKVREDRLDWADEILFDGDDSDDAYLDSFSDLTVGQAKTLLAKAREIKADEDAAEARKVAEAQANARKADNEALAARRAARDAEYARIDKAGVTTLRGEAARAGFKRITGKDPWSTPVAQLRTWLKANVRWT